MTKPVSAIYSLPDLEQSVGSLTQGLEWFLFLTRNYYLIIRTVLGIMFMVGGMLTFPMGDTAAKLLSEKYSATGLKLIRFLVGAATLIPITMILPNTGFSLERQLLVEQTVRALLIVAATILFMLAISELPLADAIGAYLVGPIVAAALSIAFLRETLSIKKLAALFIGFSGAMVIVKPGFSMEIGFVYALGAGICLGGFLVAIRASKRNIHPFASVAFQTSVGVVLLAPFSYHVISEIRLEDWWLFALMGMCSALANILTILALTYAPVAVLAPLVYVEVVGATILGYLVFNDIPTTFTISGIMLIVLAGLLLLQSKN